MEFEGQVLLQNIEIPTCTFLPCFYFLGVIQSHCICKSCCTSLNTTLFWHTLLSADNVWALMSKASKQPFDHLGVLLGVLEAEPGPGRVHKSSTSSPESFFSKADLAMRWLNRDELSFIRQDVWRTHLVPAPCLCSTTGRPLELPDGVGILISSMSVSLVSIIFILTGSALCLLFRSFP